MNIYPRIKHLLSHLRVIDILGIVVFAMGLVVIGYFLLRQSVYVDVVVRVSDRDNYGAGWKSESYLWFTDALQVGMAQYDTFSRKTIEIVKKQIYPTNQDARLVDITLRIKAVYNKRSRQYLYNGDPILIGSVQKFQLGSYSIVGLIRDVNHTASYQTKNYLVHGYLSPLFNNSSYYGWYSSYTGTPNTTGVPNYLADSIKVGDTVTDSQGKRLAVIASVQKQPAFFILANTLPYQVPDERSTEVNLGVKVAAEMVAGKPMYLGTQPLLVNSLIYLIFDKNTLGLTITDVQEEPDSGRNSN